MQSFKVVMLGSSGVGKTALVEKITSDEFSEAHVPTIGAQYVSLEFKIEDEKISLELWDTAGQEVFRSLVGFYARDAKGVFLVCDVTFEESIAELEKWSEFITDQAPGSSVILFGNKCDLSQQRMIKSEELEEFANNHGYTFIEGSAKTGQSVNDAFSQMAELVFKNSESKEKDGEKKQLKENDKKNKGGCC